MSQEKPEPNITWSKIVFGPRNVILLSKDGKVFSIRLLQTKSDHRRSLEKEFPGCTETKGGLAHRQIKDFLEGKNRTLDFPFVLVGMTRLQEKILFLCKGIPYGRTISYSSLAKKAGNANLARVVGSTMAKNPLPLLIPCHRVIRKEGKIGGFMGDAKDKSGWKEVLLERERKAALFPS